jgi:hypothetical protein
MTVTRSVTDAESALIRRVAEKLPQDRQIQLLDDLLHATAEPATPDGSRVTFEISGYQRPPYHGQQSFGVEGELLDSDGAKLSFDLFADENGRLLEFELIRWGEGSLISPNWSSLRLY